MTQKSNNEEHKRPWRIDVGSLWNEIGLLQFQFLISQGLQPSHRLLDVGCGCLRGGIHFVKYLNEGNYFGMDKEQELLEKGVQEELPLVGLRDRKVNLICSDTFNFSKFKVGFDFAIAQSVFTHLPYNSILRCLAEVKKTLAPGGKFFATFFEDQNGRNPASSILHNPGGITTSPDRDPFHYYFPAFEQIGKQVGLEVEYLGEWNHPRAQKMMVFYHGKYKKT